MLLNPRDISTEQVGQRRGDNPMDAQVLVRAELHRVTVHYELLYPRTS